MHVPGSMMSDPGMATIHMEIDTKGFAKLWTQVLPKPAQIRFTSVWVRLSDIRISSFA
jgi:hypothetical protein